MKLLSLKKLRAHHFASFVFLMGLIDTSHAMEEEGANEQVEAQNQPPEEEPHPQAQNQQLAYIANGALHFRGEEYPLNSTSSFLFYDPQVPLTLAEAQQLFPLLSHFNHLKSIQLIHSGLTDEILAFLAPNIPSTVIELYLYGNNITNQGINSLVDGLPDGIRRIDLKNNQITNAGAIELANCLTTKAHFQDLFLNDNQIGDEGGIVLIQNLSYVDLSNNPVGDQTALALAQRIPQLPNLNSIFLHHCQISDIGAIALAQAIAQHPQNVRYFEINNNNITPDGYQQIRAILQNIPNFSSHDAGRYSFYEDDEHHHGGLNQDLQPVAPVVNNIAQNLVDQVREQFQQFNLQLPLPLTYQTFTHDLVGNFFGNAEEVLEVQHEGFIIVPSSITLVNLIGTHMQGQDIFNAQMGQLNQNVIFTSGFQNASDIANLPERYRNDAHEAASFIFPIPEKRNNLNVVIFQQRNYEFFVVREVAQKKENSHKLNSVSQKNQEKSKEQNEPYEYKVNEHQEALNQQ